MTAVVRPILFLAFAVTGFSALTLQVVWQRVLSLHAGIDLMAATTVVTAFMAGLGLGSLFGGAAADRLDGRRSMLAFAASNASIGLFAWASLWLFYDVYRQYAAQLDSAAAMFAFHFVLLVIPTTLMGLSLPLLARGAVATSSEIAPLVGRLYAVNTLGAAAGAIVAGWWLVGTFGFVATVRIAGALNLAVAVVVAVLWKTGTEVRLKPDTTTDPVQLPSTPLSPGPSTSLRPGTPDTRVVWPWFLMYGLTGAVAIGLEVVYFRVIDASMRNNSYTFPTVLAMYLAFFGVGAAIAARLVARVAHPERMFLALQFGVGVTTLMGVLAFLRPPDAFGIKAFITHYYTTAGFMHGGYTPQTVADAGRLVYAHVVAPLMIMGVPVLMMGASFPFVQATVARRLESLGRRTGTLLFSNICGNVVGGALTGFVLLDTLGTAGTLQLFGVVLLLPGLAAAARLPSPPMRVAASVAAAGLVALCVAKFPSNERFWAFFHGGPTPDRFELAEDRACVTSLIDHPTETYLYINANWQNGHPYDVFHVLIGILPALMHERPERGLAVGLGIGSTAYSMAQDPRMGRVDAVEICGGEKVLINRLAERGSSVSRRLLSDPRINLVDGDGRRWLLSQHEPYDVIVVDAVRPDSAYAGNLYSVEFYELVASRLAHDGLFVQWIPTARVLNGILRVFPHVMVGEVPEYYASRFVVAGMAPLEFDRSALLERLQAVSGDAFDRAQSHGLAAFIAGDGLLPMDRPPVAQLSDGHFNNDLHPRDEYFLNEPW
jgi:predicted membrane-bound spermidine synthase